MRRNDKAFSILEMVVAITILTVVTSLLYLYSNKGFLFFDKILSFDRVQLNTKSSIELLLNNLRESSQEYIHIGSGFNNMVPLPDDAIKGAEYVYFAKFIPDKSNSEIKGLKEGINKKTNGHYDYYLAYLAEVDNKRGAYLSNKARLRIIIFPEQSIEFTDFNEETWPFPPKIEAGQEDKIKNFGFLEHFKLENNTPIFSLKNSVLDFSYLNSSDSLLSKKAVLINIKLLDDKQNVIIEMASTVVPRN